MFVYIIHSKKLNRFYTGFTTADVEERTSNHNNKYYSGNNFTKSANDWVIYLEIDVNNTNQGLQIERHIKSMKSKVYIQNLKRFPEIIVKLKNRYPGT